MFLFTFHEYSLYNININIFRFLKINDNDIYYKRFLRKS